MRSTPGNGVGHVYTTQFSGASSGAGSLAPKKGVILLALAWAEAEPDWLTRGGAHSRIAGLPALELGSACQAKDPTLRPSGVFPASSSLTFKGEGV